jgi:hypothetical protein
MPITPPPTPAGFLAFVRGQMGVNSTILPDASDYISTAYAVALEIVNPDLNTASALIYTLCVYNLAASNILNFAQDDPSAPDVPGSAPPAPYFANLRNSYGINTFVAGVVQSTADQGTSMSLLTPDVFKTFSMNDLALLKDPFGRTYLRYAQEYGLLWGLT